jgi:hypothetical protein
VVAVQTQWIQVKLCYFLVSPNLSMEWQHNLRPQVTSTKKIYATIMALFF